MQRRHPDAIRTRRIQVGQARRRTPARAHRAAADRDVRAARPWRGAHDPEDRPDGDPGRVRRRRVVATPPAPGRGADSGPVTLLELLAAPAPTGVVAPELLALVDAPLLDDRRQHPAALVVVGL